eukprot:Rhum_TRINITY_DN14163_c26_g1::Rhum_TRINITY_DN14163_c26_g1_i1::g.69531::m.69531
MPSRPTGPLGGIVDVDTPTSAPSPYLNPSANLVEQLWNTPADGTCDWNAAATAASSATTQSVCFEPCVTMCSTASSAEATTRTEHSKSQYSCAHVATSPTGSAAAAAAAAFVRSHPFTRTFFSAAAAKKAGRKAGATASCTSSVSMLLHAEGYCVFESTAIFSAFVRSAEASTYTWQMPSACPSTGIVVLRCTCCTNSFDPRGMIRSMCSAHVSISAVCSRLLSSTTDSSGTCVASRPSRIAPTISVHVRTASRPHFSSTPLPDLTASDAICTAASGRASKMMPRTPSGTATLFSTSPSASCRCTCTAPMGSGRRCRSRTPATAASNLASAKPRRPTIARARPASFAAATSAALASSMADLRASRLSAMLLRARLRSVWERAALTRPERAADWAALATSRTLLIVWCGGVCVFGNEVQIL